MMKTSDVEKYIRLVSKNADDTEKELQGLIKYLIAHEKYNLKPSTLDFMDDLCNRMIEKNNIYYDNLESIAK